jgi:hypothetical protein
MMGMLPKYHLKPHYTHILPQTSSMPFSPSPFDYCYQEQQEEDPEADFYYQNRIMQHFGNGEEERDYRMQQRQERHRMQNKLTARSMFMDPRLRCEPPPRYRDGDNWS